jgi:hypothetical protein
MINSEGVFVQTLYMATGRRILYMFSKKKYIKDISNINLQLFVRVFHIHTDRQRLIKNRRTKKMPRPKKEVSIEELIQKQEEIVAKSKAKYDADVAKLKDLHAQKDEIRKKELLNAVENSGKSYEEILAFLTQE